MPSKSTGKSAKPKTAKPRKAAKARPSEPKAVILTSQVVYSGSVFRVHRDILIEPNGRRAERDIIRHGGSAVILAIDNSKSKKDPWIVMERQYRHAASQFLWELPAGKIDAGEKPLEGAQRELIEETGYRAKKWWPLVEYFASPGFLGEAMKVFVAEGLQAGEARPEEDESIEIRLVKLSEVLKMIEKDAIHDGKTLTSVLLYDYLRRRGSKR
jgi:8-oxo-dGTP pyrophosphatase MutT (NUDIX family)